MKSLLRRGILLAVYIAIVGVSVDADVFGKECASNSDCADGATCVAGDAETAVQRCVAGTPCGGSVLGACPGDESTGQLACIWRPDKKTCSQSSGGCVNLGGEPGIYKCISLERCDQYFGADECTGSCSVNGKQCNGRGTCQLTGESVTKPSFGCVCESGWNGTRCEGVVDDSCVVDVGQCGEHGTCVKNACKCSSGYTGVQCEIAPPSLSSSGSMDSTGSKGKTTSVPSPKPAPTNAQNGSASRANSGNTIVKKSGGPSALVIIMAILVALIVVGAILFVVFARRRRRQQEAADASGFNRTDSVIAGGEVRTGPPTPKGKIVIM